MYVLARSNLTEMLLNVEYMMELMDPALQLGEGESLPQAHLWVPRAHCTPPASGPGKQLPGCQIPLSPEDRTQGPDTGPVLGELTD